MASCGIHFTLRCPSGAPCFASTCRPQNPRAPLHYINLILSSSSSSSSSSNLKPVTVRIPCPTCSVYKEFDSLYFIRFSKTLVFIAVIKHIYASYSRRSRPPALGAVALLLWGLTWLPRRNLSHRTECWSVLSYLSAHGNYIIKDKKSTFYLVFN